MRIVDRATFLAMPAGTVYAKFKTTYIVEVTHPDPKGEMPLPSDTDCDDVADSLLDGWGFPEGVEVKASFVKRVYL
jgi:hypothetical protein